MVCSTSASLISRLAAFFRACADQGIGFIRSSQVAKIIHDCPAGFCANSVSLDVLRALLSARRAGQNVNDRLRHACKAHWNMPTEVKKEIELEIAYVLFVDIVGYSKLVTAEQRRLLELLNRIVREAEHFHTAEANGRLITVPTGDGMALVFYNTPEAPVECALEIGCAAREHPELKLRMGMHSGPVSGVVDVSGRSNIAGAGINIAQRVMDCGDAGHVLISKHMAEDLEQYGHWKRNLHDLGECEVKHGVRVSVVNLYTEDLGNPEVPQKFRQARKGMAPVVREKKGRGWVIAAAVVLIAALIIAAVLLSRRSASVATGSGAPSTPPATPTPAAAAIPEKSIAVMPFENLSEDKANAYFADGIQDEILTRLSKIADLKVISRTSTQQVH